MYKVCEFLLASEELRVTQATHARNYLQMQVTVVVKSKLMKPVQGLISLCGAHISAGTLYKLIHEQLKDPGCPRHLSTLGSFGFLPVECVAPLPCPASLQLGQLSSAFLLIGILPYVWERIAKKQRVSQSACQGQTGDTQLFATSCSPLQQMHLSSAFLMIF